MPPGRPKARAPRARGRQRMRRSAQAWPCGSRMTITTRSPGASGCLFVVAAPSGGGKSSMVNALLEREPGIRLSVSYTTRPPRPGESEGIHYHFVDVAQFLPLKDARRIPRARVCPRQLVRDVGDVADGAGRGGPGRAARNRLAGRAQVRRLIPDSVHIFILPPSIEALRERLDEARPGPAGGDRSSACEARARRCATAGSSIMLL